MGDEITYEKLMHEIRTAVSDMEMRLMSKLLQMESRFEATSVRVEKNSNAIQKYQTYFQILWFAVGVITTIITAMIIDLIT
jgi:hypothetical protein